MCWVFANGCLHVIACCCHLGAVMEMCRTIWAVSHLSSVGAVVDCLALLCCGKHRIYCGKKFCFLMEGYLVLGKWRFSSVTAVNLFHLCYLLLCFFCPLCYETGCCGLLLAEINFQSMSIQPTWSCTSVHLHVKKYPESFTLQGLRAMLTKTFTKL